MSPGRYVLELVPEPVCAAGLVERGPGPEPAGERLVDQPAVEHDVMERSGVRPGPSPGRLPEAPDVAQRRLVVGSAHAGPGRRGSACVRLAEKNDDRGPGPARQLEGRLQRGAGPRPAAAGLAAGGRGPAGGRVRRTVPAQELRPVRGPRRLSATEVEEGDPAAELGCSSCCARGSPPSPGPVSSRCGGAGAAEVPSAHSA